MKAKMILAALLVGAMAVAMQAPASAGIFTDSYLVGDKDDFDNGDGDGVFDLTHGEDLPLPWQTMNTPEDGNTDRALTVLHGEVFDFRYNVASRPTAPVSGLLRLTTWDVNYTSPYAWSGQPIKLTAPGGDVVLSSILTSWPVPPPPDGRRPEVVQLDVITLDAAALAAIGAAGGEVHVIIGTTDIPLVASDVAMIDYAQLELSYERNEDNTHVPEGSSALLLVTGLAGLVTKRKRRS